MDNTGPWIILLVHYHTQYLPRLYKRRPVCVALGANVSVLFVNILIMFCVDTDNAGFCSLVCVSESKVGY